MDFVANITDDILIWGTAGCGFTAGTSVSITSTYSFLILVLLLIHVATKFLHEFLRHFGQPRIVSDFIVGMVVGNVTFIGSYVHKYVGLVIQLAGQSSMMCYMFVLGLEMEPRTMFRHPGWESTIAYAGVFSTVIITFAFYPAIISHALDITNLRGAWFVAVFAIVLSNTASPILTRLTTELKIGKSHIGRLVVNAAIVTDMVVTSVVSVGLAVANTPPFLINFMEGSGSGSGNGNGRDGSDHFGLSLMRIFFAVFIISAQTMFIVVVVPHFAEWINERNPEGKPIRGLDLAIALALVLGLFWYGSTVSPNPAFNSFLVGLAFPKEGRFSSMLISKINFLINTFGLPYYLCAIGTNTHFRDWSVAAEGAKKTSVLLSWAKLVLVAVIGTLGKVSGTFAAATLYGFRFTEAISIGLLLNIKGHFHILIASLALEKGIINKNTFLVLLFDIIITVIYIPVVARVIVKRVQPSIDLTRRTLQGLDPSAGINMVMGILGPHNVPTAITIVEAARGHSSVPLTVHAIDLVELNERTAEALMHGEGTEAVAVADEAIVNMREKISLALETYLEDKCKGLTVVRLLAISPFSSMHEDICQAALDTGSVLIVLPFHRSQRAGGGMESFPPGFRQMNRKVLQYAPCSVGILVDRGLSSLVQSSNTVSRKAAVIFIGGSDDREVLVLAGRMARHPGFSLTTIRFLPEAGAETILARTRGLVVDAKLQEKEMHLDDECFAKFFENHIAGGRVGYLEKYISSGADAVVMLKGLESKYSLFIVGRGGNRNPVLTAGMSDWAECPELGPVGDILSSSDFSTTASVFIVQQHDVERDKDAGDEDVGFS